MPRHPNISASVASTRGSVFSSLANRVKAYEGETFPLHVGDTWMEPPEGCRMEDLTVAENPGMHRYASPQGLPELIETITTRTRALTGAETSNGDVLVAAGATGALGAAIGAIMAPGEEVLILAPYWPLIAGIVQSFHGRPVLVPFLDRVATVGDALEAVGAELTDRTVALYLNSPNNPTGRVIPREWIAALVEWARQNDLWVLADEVYEHYVYEGEHTYTRPLAPERTFSVHSFSKAYGMAGNRCGYVVGPGQVMPDLRKVSLHTFYSTPTASQIAALRVLQGAGALWVEEARRAYAELGRFAARRLQVPDPEGGTFLFLDVSEVLDHRGLMGFLEDCVDRGLFLAPGPSFGPYPEHVRICFTSAEPEVVRRGVEVLAEMLGR